MSAILLAMNHGDSADLFKAPARFEIYDLLQLDMMSAYCQTEVFFTNDKLNVGIENSI